MKEIEFLKANFQTMKVNDIATELNRPKTSVSSYAYTVLKLSKNKEVNNG